MLADFSFCSKRPMLWEHENFALHFFIRNFIENIYRWIQFQTHTEFKFIDQSRCSSLTKQHPSVSQQGIEACNAKYVIFNQRVTVCRLELVRYPRGNSRTWWSIKGIISSLWYKLQLALLCKLQESADDTGLMVIRNIPTACRTVVATMNVYAFKVKIANSIQPFLISKEKF